MVFNLFRLAAIIHGIKGRLARGNASSAHAAESAKALEPLAALAWAQAERARGGMGEGRDSGIGIRDW